MWEVDLKYRYVAGEDRFFFMLKPSDFERSVTSPTHGDMTLDVAAQRFVWHANHHIAQITSLRERKGW